MSLIKVGSAVLGVAHTLSKVGGACQTEGPTPRGPSSALALAAASCLWDRRRAWDRARPSGLAAGLRTTEPPDHGSYHCLGGAPGPGRRRG
jgi:hypothetical protein